MNTPAPNDAGAERLTLDEQIADTQRRIDGLEPHLGIKVDTQPEP